MKTFSLITGMAVLILSVVGCKSTTQEEKEAYFESGAMDEQVQSWKTKPGGRY